ncbi:unnamed protein product [Strongylus vulgaris]|uniref:Uncharacterized protein n=1 Tax=Strongylus vulgaris TaxID=40348 RepID=A0A3P7LCZ2_STRVU|nr:unnamed protein product [Strongylus vulgaris]
MRVTQRYDSCGDRPHSHQPKVVTFSVVPSFSSGSDHRLLRAKVRFSRSVVPSFSSGSDHRLLRAKVRFSQKLEEDLPPCWRKEKSYMTASD